MRTLNLTRSIPVSIDINGNAVAQLGPTVPGEVWYPTTVSVGTSQLAADIINEAQCKVYCGASPQQGQYVDGTLSGSTGDSTTNVTGQVLYPGQYVIAVWSGGDYQAVATMQVQGTRVVP